MKFTNIASAAEAYCDMGMKLVPLPEREKRPLHNNWGAQLISVRELARKHYEENPNQNVGVALGASRVCSLDIDCMDSFKKIMESFDVPESELDNYPAIRGASKGLRLMFAVPSETNLQYRKINWASKDDPTGEKYRAANKRAITARQTGDFAIEQAARSEAKKYARYTVFELRVADEKTQRQDVLPPSIHPDTGKPYEWVVEPVGGFPEPPSWLLSIWTGFDDLKDQVMRACPWFVEPAKPQKRDRTIEANIPPDQVNIVDLYNDKVSISEELETYGYINRGSDTWTSPHSTTGSAGVKVFTDSHPQKCHIHHASDPLCSTDSGQLVSAFDLYAYYEHGEFTGGFYESIKSAAKLLGVDTEYTSESDAVDITGFLDMVRGTKITKNTISTDDAAEAFEVPDLPSDLSSLSGVIGAITKHTLESAPKPLLLPTIEAAHVAVSHVIGRSFNTDSGVYGNLYSAVIAETGSGKEAVKSAVSEFLYHSDMEADISSLPNSKGALMTVLNFHPTSTIITDELGVTFRAASKDKSDKNFASFKAGILEVYSASGIGGKISADAMSNMGELKKGSKSEAEDFALTVKQPYVNFIGFSQPSVYVESMTKEFLESGLTNRFLTILPTEGWQKRRRVPAAKYPKLAFDWLKAIEQRKKMSSTSQADYNPLVQDEAKGRKDPQKPITLSLTDEAADYIDKLEDKCVDELMPKYEKYLLHSLFTRTTLLAEKYALIIQLSKDPWATKIDLDSVKWACEWVLHHQTVFADLYRSERVSSPRERLIKELVDSMGDREIAKKEMSTIPCLKQFGTKKRNEQLQDLEEDGILVSYKVSSGKGRPSVFYRVRSLAPKELLKEIETKKAEELEKIHERAKNQVK